jgi:hypothetical protein
MAHHWTPRDQLEPSVTPNEWFVVDRAAKVAIIRLIELGDRKDKLFRSVTYSPEPSNRTLIGYFPKLEHAVYYTWMECVKRHPSISERK